MAHSTFPSQIVSYVDGIPDSKLQPTPLVPSHIHANLMLIKKKQKKKKNVQTRECQFRSWGGENV